MKIPMLMSGWQIAGLIFGLIFGVIIFGFACWWLHFVYTWMNSMSSSNLRTARAMERIANKYAGGEEKKNSGESKPSQTTGLKPRPEVRPTSETRGGYRKDEPPEDLENQSETVKMYWRMKMASERQENGKKDKK